MRDIRQIRYVQGDATAPEGTGLKIIAHVCNDAGAWGAGFVMALSRRWPEPEAAYRKWHQIRAINDFGLGAVQMVTVSPDIQVANMVGQHGAGYAGSRPPVRYEAIGRALGQLARNAGTHAGRPAASVHMPRIGCGLAGGDWGCIEPLILDRLCSHAIWVTVYDLPPGSAAPGTARPAGSGRTGILPAPGRG